MLRVPLSAASRVIAVTDINILDFMRNGALLAVLVTSVSVGNQFDGGWHKWDKL